MKNKTRKRLLCFLMEVLLLLCEASIVSFAADLSGRTESVGDVSEGDVTAGDMTAGDGSNFNSIQKYAEKQRKRKCWNRQEARNRYGLAKKKGNK